MKLIRTATLLSLITLTMACGYSKKATTPPGAGTMPTIAELSPSSANHVNPQAFTLTVNGSNFNGDAVVNWNSSAQTTTFVTGGQLTVPVPASAIMNAGSISVTVTNPGTPGGIYGGGTSPETSTAMTFTIN